MLLFNLLGKLIILPTITVSLLILTKIDAMVMESVKIILNYIFFSFRTIRILLGFEFKDVLRINNI